MSIPLGRYGSQMDCQVEPLNPPTNKGFHCNHTPNPLKLYHLLFLSLRISGDSWWHCQSLPWTFSWWRKPSEIPMVVAPHGFSNSHEFWVWSSQQKQLPLLIQYPFKWCSQSVNPGVLNLMISDPPYFLGEIAMPYAWWLSVEKYLR